MVLTGDRKALRGSVRRVARERLLPDYRNREKAVLDRALVADLGAPGRSMWTCRSVLAAWASMQ